MFRLNDYTALTASSCAQQKAAAKDTDKEEFVEIFPILANEIMRELPTTYEMPPHAIAWMRKVLFRVFVCFFACCVLRCVREEQVGRDIS